MLKKQAKKKDDSCDIKKSPKSLPLPTTSLASMESLSMPRDHQIVLSADLQCAQCQKKVYDVISRATGVETLVVNVTEKKVILTCKSEMKGPSGQVVSLNKNSTLQIVKKFLYMTKS